VGQELARHERREEALRHRLGLAADGRLCGGDGGRGAAAEARGSLRDAPRRGAPQGARPAGAPRARGGGVATPRGSAPGRGAGRAALTIRRPARRSHVSSEGSRRIRKQTGNFLEDFRPGQVFRHKGGKTLTEGLFATFTEFAMTANPLAKNARYARAHGFAG